MSAKNKAGVVPSGSDTGSDAREVSGDAGPPGGTREAEWLCTDGGGAPGSGAAGGGPGMLGSPPRRATTSELEMLRFNAAQTADPDNYEPLGAAFDARVTLWVLAELAEHRAARRGYQPPSAWKLVQAPTMESWLEARKSRLTASNVPAVFGCSSYGNRAKLVRETAHPPLVGFRGNQATRLGAALEEGVMNAFAFEAGLTVAQLRWPSGASMLFDHPTIPRFAASPDGVVLGPDGSPVACVECKVTSDIEAWRGEKSALCQLRAQMAVTGLGSGWLVVNAGTKMRFKAISQDPAFISALPDAVSAFWKDVEAAQKASLN